MKLRMDGCYRTIKGNLPIKLLHHFPTEPQYPWIGAVIYDGKVIACAWTEEGIAQNPLHNLYDVETGKVYIAKVFIAVKGYNTDEARVHLETLLQGATDFGPDEVLGWSYEWNIAHGEYGRIRVVEGADPDTFNHHDYSLTDAWSKGKVDEDL